MSSISVKKWGLIYGYAGLIPFVFLALIVWFLPHQSGLTASLVFACYSTIIMSFLAGILWGTALQLGAETVKQTSLLRFSIVLSLISWVSLVFVIMLSPTWPWILTIGLVINALAFLVLRRYELQRCDLHYPEWFIRMRSWLTAIVILSHTSVSLFALQFIG